jgi:WXG100 family type VII secretion target
MPVEFQFDSDQLELVSRRFGEQADQLETSMSDVENCLNNLKMGGWIGLGADRFYDEMDNLFLPNLNKLKELFNQLSDQTAQAAKAVLEAEEGVRGAANQS